MNEKEWNKLEKGFYYHYKHDPSREINDYAYEVLNVAHHTEIDDWDNGAFVIYRPLYDRAKVYKAGKHYDARPFTMFTEKVTKEGKIFPRFKKIEDKKIIEKLKKIREEMYG